MSDSPVGREDLERAVDSLKDHINDKFEDQHKYHKEVVNNIHKRIDIHDNALHGNGTAGLVKDVDRIQTSFKTLKKTAAAIATFFGGVGAYLGLK